MHFEGNYENREEYIFIENAYFDPIHINGSIRICHIGCGHFINLVVNGEEYGHVWSDNRCSDAGINPFSYEDGNPNCRLSFLDWYEKWIYQAMKMFG